jgi:hypothetical protein
VTASINTIALLFFSNVLSPMKVPLEKVNDKR